jgi:hypothetical protein
MEIFAARALVFAVARVAVAEAVMEDKARSANGGSGEIDLEADADLG